MKLYRDASFEFIEDGFSVIHKYRKGALYQHNPKS